MSEVFDNNYDSINELLKQYDGYTREYEGHPQPDPVQIEPERDIFDTQVQELPENVLSPAAAPDTMVEDDDEEEDDGDDYEDEHSLISLPNMPPVHGGQGAAGGYPVAHAAYTPVGYTNGMSQPYTNTSNTLMSFTKSSESFIKVLGYLKLFHRIPKLVTHEMRRLADQLEKEIYSYTLEQIDETAINLLKTIANCVVQYASLGVVRQLIDYIFRNFIGYTPITDEAKTMYELGISMLSIELTSLLSGVGNPRLKIFIASIASFFMDYIKNYTNGSPSQSQMTAIADASITQGMAHPNDNSVDAISLLDNEDFENVF